MEHDLARRVLATLNRKQHQAVTAPSAGILQIVAGPGTGKTKVIVSRVAHLLLHENISPQNIIVTTFTKKAANEMMERLRELFIGTEIAVGRLLMGTFHSICYKIIQRYGRLIGLEGVSIANDKDASQILAGVLASKISEEEWKIIDALPQDQKCQYYAASSPKPRTFDAKRLKRQISRAKSSGFFPQTYDAQKSKNMLVSTVYHAYQRELCANKVLDFDDCLLYCWKILSQFPVLKHVEHTLVDEFQDTNEIQLQLMYLFAKGDPGDADSQSNVTIVGDPDQSIYAFRDAQSVNFQKMRDHYAKQDTQCQVITLDENYRSTSDILSLSETVMRQQAGRVVKNLTSQFTQSFKPLQAVLKSSEEEARWLAHQIDFLAGLPNELFQYSDMAVLVRSAFQTRAIEDEFVRRKIPYFMVRGKAFWERKEVVAMLDYLRCVANDDDKIAFMRSVNFPKRGLGPKALADMEAVIDRERGKTPQSSVFHTLARIVRADVKTSLGPKLRGNLAKFLDVLENAKKVLGEGFDLGTVKETDVMETAFGTLLKGSGIEAEFEESVDSGLNIKEVQSQLMAFELPPEDPLPDYPGQESTPEQEITGPMYIRKFLESISLYDTDLGETEDQAKKPKVSISTIHGSKGLEWPVVFVPGVSEGLLPASFATNDGDPESVNEERRCFYVATSRAQTLLYISAFTSDGGKWGRSIDSPSRFMATAKESCASVLQFSTREKLKSLYEIRGKQLTAQDFDAEAYFRDYAANLLEYVKRKNPKIKATDGFTKASQLRVSQNGASFAPASVSLSKNKTYSTKTPARPPVPKPQKPLYSESGSKRIHVNGLPERVHVTSGVKRAPAYIPVRSGAKKRLGMK